MLSNIAHLTTEGHVFCVHLPVLCLEALACHSLRPLPGFTNRRFIVNYCSLTN